MPSHGRLFLPILIAFVGLLGCDQLQTPNPLDPNAQNPPPNANASSPAGTRSIAGGPPIQVFFSKVDGSPAQNKLDPDNIADRCAQVIDSAQRTLDVCGFEIDNRVIVEAIVAAHFRGVKVRVIAETDYLKELGPLTFEKAGIPLVSDQRSGLMHNKFLVIDNRAVWTGSFNFTENCAYKNNNNGLYIQSDRVAQNYAKWFDWFWTVGRKSRRGGGPTPHPDVELPDGTHVECRFTTFDKMEDTVLDVIGEAKKSIKFLAFSFTHAKIAKAMEAKAAAGVKVYGVFEAKNSNNVPSSRYHEMVGKANISVLLDRNPYNLHHKVIIVDDQVAIAGSYNFSENAGSANDENYVVVWKNRGVAKQFADEFAKIYNLARAETATSSGVSRR